MYTPNVLLLAHSPLTCQYTLDGCAPPMSSTVLPAAVVNEVSIWKRNTALGSPLASRVSVPVTCSDEVDLYTPGPSAVPPISPDRKAVGTRLAAMSYAQIKLLMANSDTESSR